MKRLMLAVLAISFSVTAWAGGTAVIGADNEQTTLEYADGKIRLNAELQEGSDGYLVIDGDKAYAVSFEGGQPTVLDLAAMGKVLGALGGAAGQAPLQLERKIGEIQELRPLGRSETLAGITGQVHELVYLDGAGKRQVEEVVLSRDTAARELTGVMLQLARTLATTFGQPDDPLDALGRMLVDDEQGLLRVGDEMRLISLDTKTPAAERFVLPAEPSSMPDIGGLMKDAARQVPEALEGLGNR